MPYIDQPTGSSETRALRTALSTVARRRIAVKLASMLKQTASPTAPARVATVSGPVRSAPAVVGATASIFVSYASADRAQVQRLVATLRAQKFNVNWDQDIRAGEDFREVIHDKIVEAVAVVVVWSEHSTKSRFVLGEAALAHDMGKLVTTHLLEFDLRRLPIDFRSLNSIPCVAIDRLVASLDPHVRGGHGK